MGVGRSSSLRTTAERSPLHDVRQHAPRDRGSTRYKFKFMDECLDFPSTSIVTINRCSTQKAWWSQTGSNRRPPACKAGALPTELWPRSRRKSDTPERVVGLGRLELPTSRLSSARSNQLSYKPKPLRSRTWRSRPWWSSQQTATVIG